MTKNDLESGMIVKSKEGGLYLTHGNRLLNGNGYSYIELLNYNDDLTNEHDDSCTIVAIYESDADSLDSLFREHNLKTIWEREQLLKYGDKIIVTNARETYSTNIHWFEEHEDDFDLDTLLKFKYNQYPSAGGEYTVLYVDVEEKKVLIGCNSSVHLMDMRGVEKVG